MPEDKAVSLSNEQGFVSNSQAHVSYLDGMRAVAAIFVVMHHCVLTYSNNWNINNLPYVERLFVLFFFEGHYAVDFFIVISGYCLMLPLIKYDYKLKNGVKDFFLRRAKRILPTYYCAMALSLLLIWVSIDSKTGTLWDMSIPINWQAVATHIFLIHDFFHATVFKINYVFWSIAVEGRIYVLFPVLLLLWRKTGRLVTLVFAIVFSVLAHYALLVIFAGKVTLEPKLAGIFPYLILFVFGMFAADIAHSTQSIQLSKIRKVIPWGVVTSLFAILSFAANHFYRQGRLSLTAVDIVMGLTCALLMVALAKPRSEGGRTGWLARLLGIKPLAFFGMFAYSIYLLHAPFLQVFSQYFLGHQYQDRFFNMSLLILIGIPAIIFISYLFFLVCEKPFLKKKRKPTTEELEKETVLESAP